MVVLRIRWDEEPNPLWLIRLISLPLCHCDFNYYQSLPRIPSKSSLSFCSSINDKSGLVSLL